MKLPKLSLKKPSRKTIFRLFLCTLLIGLVTFVGTQFQVWQARAAATIYWDGGGNGTAWSDPLNWSTDVLPVASDEVLIDTVSTVKISEPVTIKSLTLGKIAGGTASVLEFAYDSISLGALTITGGDLTVYYGANVTHTAAVTTNILGRINFNITSGNANIYGTINVDSKGYPSGYGPGAGVNGSGGSGGGGYGGNGGNGQTRVGGITYGDIKLPDRLGSAGGHYYDAGSGGGAVKLTVSGTTTINGTITAGGGYGGGYQHMSGGGSGGSIWINTNTLTGTGSVRANGGTSGDWDADGGGGGGGRVALYYTTDSSTFLELSASGGRPSASAQFGGAGTIYKKAVSATYGDYIIDNNANSWDTNISKVAITPLPNGFQAENLTIDNFAIVNCTDTFTITNILTLSLYSHLTTTGTLSTGTLQVLTNATYYNQLSSTTTYSTLSWTGGILSDNGGTMALLSGGGTLVVPATSTLYGNTTRSFTDITINGTLTHNNNGAIETYKINYTASGNLIVNAGGQINIDSRGFSSGEGPGQGVDGSGGTGGGGYGGNGGNGQTRTGGITYGSYTQPTDLGSAGGHYYEAGYGGGAVKLTVAGTSTINGTITAGGGYGGGYQHMSGGGSGGSIWITTNVLTGTGNIRANGGTSGDWDADGGGGGGGRVALYYTTDTSNFANLSANGGRPSASAQYGGAGTVYKKAASATYGDLIISSNEGSWDTNISKVATTNLANNLNLENLTISKFARVEYASTLNITNVLTHSYNAHLLVTGTIQTNTYNISNNAWLYNQNTANISYSSLDWTGGIISDNGGTMALLSGGGAIIVPATSTLYGNTTRSFTNITINGTLTHNANSSIEAYKLIYTASGNLTVNSGGQINLDSKGFYSGEGPGQGVDGPYGTGGGGYGGVGGNGQNRAGGTTYGSYSQPTDLGSAGGHYYDAGAGGGAVKLTVAGTSTINGTITAGGGYGGGYQHMSGGGSGGSIWITTNVLTGTGNIRANGGTSGDWDYDGGGGGGGRIALYYTTDTSNFANVSANGGRPSASAQYGGAGTVYKKAASATYGDLIISSNEVSWDTDISRVANTPLDNNFQIDNLTINKFARVELTNSLLVSNTFNLTHYAHFRNLGNTQIGTLNINNNGWLYNEVASTLTYSSINWGGGKITDNGGTMSLVSSGGALDIPATSILYGHTPRTFTNISISGMLSHYSNTSEAKYKINYTSTGNFTLAKVGSINIDARGYSSGNGPGAGVGGPYGTGGGGYGGNGGNGQNRVGGITYGDQLAPDWLGSAGGHYYNGGAGGGALKLTVAGTSTISGTITANGGNGDGWQHMSGGGSGGSIWIVTDILEGNGDVRANGGVGAWDWDYDGGGGGGGRIAFYYATNNAAFTTLTANGGNAGGPGGQRGVNGTIFLGGKSADPINLRQFKQDGTTGIGENGATNENTVILTFQVQDGNASDVLTPEVEFVPLGTTFNNIATNTGDPVTYSGTIVTASVPVPGLADNSSYHWQARACDATNLCSDWVSFGNNTEAEADLRVVMNAAPNAPTIPESSFFINGQYTNDLQPTLGFVLSDPNNTDAVGYELEVDVTNEFLFPIVQYKSVVGAQGTQLFTIGQVVGDGEYIHGEEGQELTTGEYYWRVKAIDDKAGESAWSVAPGTPSFKIDLSRPTNATEVRMKAHLNAVNEYAESETPTWFKRNDLFFSWTDGSDTQGVKGYCVYLGTEIDGDPATEKGLLGTSPISTSGTTCQFITDQTEIDFSNSALRSYDWLTSSNDKYYFKVKTIDVANNTFEGPDETNFISFLFDNTAPQNVTAISAASGTFSSTADMFFTWPTGFTQGASDAHSQVLGFQYALNSKDTWWGDSLDEDTGLSYSTMDTEQPLFFPQEVRDLVQLGQNTVYFRIVDRAGNYSELRTAFINYGGEAPKFAQGEEITVTPRQNNINRFAFSWPEAIPSEGNTVASYYYMINTPPPVSFATITSNSATYIATTETSIPEANISGLRKGANTIYVAVVDQVGNYSPTNILSATFYLNSELPDPPLDVAVADISIKDVSIWRAAVVWSEPEYMGTGNLTYHVYRSEDGETWEKIATTTGLTYIDVVAESKAYYWKVASTDNSDQSIAEPSMSNAVTLIPRGKYLVPADLTSGPASSSISTTKATISWTTSRTCDSKVAFGLASGNYFDWEPSMSAQITEHKISLANLDPGTTYYYKARWTDEDGNTGESEEMSFTTEPAPEVKNVRISNLGISGAIINFTTTKASSVKVYYGPTAAFGGIKEIATSKLETSYSLELDKLEDGTKYYYKINTLDEEGKEYEGTILDFTTLPRPRVYNIKIQQVAKTAQSTLFVTWDSNTSVSSIVTYYPETNPELMRDNVEIALKDGQHEMLIKGLFPDTVYVVQVRGKDIIGNEAVSDTIRITTSADSRAPQISTMILEGSNVTTADGGVSSQLVISWNTDEPSTSQVEYGEGSGEDYNQLTQEDQDLSYNHVVIISGLTPSKVYHLRAISKDSAGNISKSVDTVTITPKATDNAFYLVVTTLKEAFGFLDNL